MKYCPVCEEEIVIIGSDEYGCDIYDCNNRCEKDDLDDILEFYV